MNSRFWVVGAEYTNTSFDQFIRGSERVMGPYSDRGSALIAWRQVAEKTRGNLYARYTVAQESGQHVS